MIVLDTNVVSAMMRSPVDEPVAAWLRRRHGEALVTTVVTLMEIRHGLERLPAGRRRAALEARLEEIVPPKGGVDILSFDADAAEAAGAFLAHREAIGWPAEGPDMMIAGIVASIGATLATQDSRGFAGLAIRLENPYQDG